MAELEIIAFDGTVEVECGRSLPIAHLKDDDRYTLLSTNEAVLWDAKEMSELLESGRATKLSKPVLAFDDATVLFATGGFLAAVDEYNNLIANGHWQKIETNLGETWASCITR